MTCSTYSLNKRISIKISPSNSVHTFSLFLYNKDFHIESKYILKFSRFFHPKMYKHYFVFLQYDMFISQVEYNYFEIA